QAIRQRSATGADATGGDVLAAPAGIAHHTETGDSRARVDSKDQRHAIAITVYLSSPRVYGRTPAPSPAVSGIKKAATSAAFFTDTRQSAQLLHDLVGDLGVVVDVLHVVQILQHVDQLEHLLGGFQIGDRRGD